jgi:hypothetical protein
VENKGSILTRVLLVLFIVGTIVSLCIVIGNINNKVSFYFLIGYLFFAFLLILYIPAITILNSRQLKWAEIRGKLIKFIILFALFGITNYMIDYFFRPMKIDLFREFSISIGLAFGISFFDVTFLKRNK